MPIADLALSDATSIWVLRHADAAVGQGSGSAGRIFEDAIVGTFIFLASVLLAWPVTRMRRLQGVFEGFDDYQVARRAEMTRWRSAMSRAVNAPFVALGRVAERIEQFGVVLGTAHETSRTRQVFARFLVDVGQVNSLGTTAVALQETVTQGLPVRWRRIARLSIIIAASWLVTAEFVRSVYAFAALLGPFGPVVRAPLEMLGRMFDLLTGLDLQSPLSTPVPLVAFLVVAVALAMSGWNVARFHESRIDAGSSMSTA